MGDEVNGENDSGLKSCFCSLNSSFEVISRDFNDDR